MKTDILLHVEDPGAINLVKGFPEACFSRDLNLVIIGHGIAGTVFKDHHSFYEPKNETASELIKKVSPALLIVGTSENPNSFGLLLIEEAKILGIYSIGLVDMFCNFDKRFRGKSNNPLKYCPNEIFLPDWNTRDQFKKMGISKSALTVVGNPAYQNAINFRKNKETLLKQKPSSMNAEGHLSILFVAEGWDKLNPNASKLNKSYSLHGSGKSNFRTVIAIEELFFSLDRAGQSFDMTLRLHPNSVHADFMPVADDFDNISSGGDVYELCWNHDLIVGITSMLVLESALIGMPTLAILPDPSEKCWMPNLVLGPTKSVSSRIELDNFWSEKSFDKKVLAIPEWANYDSMEIIFSRVELLLEQQLSSYNFENKL